jgi:hypothetical protein
MAISSFAVATQDNNAPVGVPTKLVEIFAKDGYYKHEPVGGINPGRYSIITSDIEGITVEVSGRDFYQLSYGKETLINVKTFTPFLEITTTLPKEFGLTLNEQVSYMDFPTTAITNTDTDFNYGHGRNIAYKDGTYLVVGRSAGNSRVYTSTNGATWTDRGLLATLSGQQVWTGGDTIAHNGEFFIAHPPVNYNWLIASSDGINWAYRGTSATALHSLGTRLLKANNNVINWSDNNGTTWSANATGIDANSVIAKFLTIGAEVYAISYHSGYTTSKPSAKLYKSADNGQTWTTVSSLGFNALDFAYDATNNIMVASAGDAVNGYNSAPYYSLDKGLTWTLVTGFTSWSNAQKPVTFAKGKFYYGGDNAAYVMVSTNGISWTRSYGNNSFASTIVELNNIIFRDTTGTSTLGLIYSNDGTTFTPFLVAGTTGTGIAYGNGKYVISTDTAVGLVGPSLSNLSAVNIGTPIANVVFGNGIFVGRQVSGSYYIVTSTDGLTWTIQTAAGAQAGFYPSYFINGRFYRSGGNNSYLLYSSLDGITWTLLKTMPLQYTRFKQMGNYFVAYRATTSEYLYLTKDFINWKITRVQSSAIGTGGFGDVDYDYEVNSIFWTWATATTFSTPTSIGFATNANGGAMGIRDGIYYTTIFTQAQNLDLFTIGGRVITTTGLMTWGASESTTDGQRLVHHRIGEELYGVNGKNHKTNASLFGINATNKIIALKYGKPSAISLYSIGAVEA